jgi:hypothetical protein
MSAYGHIKVDDFIVTGDLHAARDFLNENYPEALTFDSEYKLSEPVADFYGSIEDYFLIRVDDKKVQLRKNTPDLLNKQGEQ